MERSIRLATLADAPAFQAIYAPIVRDSATSFELDPPTATAYHGDAAEHRLGSAGLAVSTFPSFP